MTAYFILEVRSVSDREKLKDYQRLGGATISRFGGRPLVGYGRQEIVEGDRLDGTVVIEFDSFEDARNWYYSTEYQEALKHRLAAAISRAVIVEGFVPADSILKTGTGS